MLKGIVRESIGKSSSKQLRRDGYLLAEIYGKGAENIHCAFMKNEFIRYVKNKTGLIFSVEVGGKEYPVVIKEYQKSPTTYDLMHVDLQLAQNGVASRFQVPVKTSGTPVGLKNKGLLVYSKKRVKIKCTPENLPNEFILDVSPLDVGDSILVRDLPKNDDIAMLENDSVAVVGVIKAK